MSGAMGKNVHGLLSEAAGGAGSGAFRAWLVDSGMVGRSFRPGTRGSTSHVGCDGQERASRPAWRRGARPPGVRRASRLVAPTPVAGPAGMACHPRGGARGSSRAGRHLTRVAAHDVSLSAWSAAPSVPGAPSRCGC